MKATRDIGLLFQRYVIQLLRNPVWLIVGFSTPILYLVLFMPLLKHAVGAAGLSSDQVVNLFLPGILSLLARLLLAAALLLLAGLLAWLLLTRILGLLARVLVWIAHSGSPLLNTSWDQPPPRPLVAREQGFPDVFNVSMECHSRGSGTGCKNNPVQALLLISGAVAA